MPFTNFSTRIWKKKSSREKKLIIGFLIFSFILTLSIILYAFIPRITYDYDSTTDTYSVNKVYGFSSSYTIPSYHNGKEVTLIKSNAFYNKTWIKNVYFEDDSNITEIDTRAFYGCGVTEITIPASVTDIYQNAFSYSDLVSIYFEDGSELNAISGSMFFDCESLTTISLPNSVDSIGSFAFFNCFSLTTIDLKDYMTVYSNAFYGCTITINCSNTSNFQDDWDNGATVTINS